MEVDLRRREPFREVQRIAGLDQDVEPPALDLALVVGFEELAHGATVRVPGGNPCLRDSADAQLLEPGESVAGRGDGVVDPVRELLEAGLEHGTLRLGVAGDALQASAHLGLCRGEPLLQSRDDLGALPLERLVDLRDPALEPLDAGVADLGEPVGEDRLRLAREGLDGAVELTRQGCEPTTAAEILL